MRKFIWGIMLILMTSVVLVACSNGDSGESSSEGGSDTITVWAMGEKVNY